MILYGILLYYVVLYYIKLYYIILYYILLCSVILYFAVAFLKQLKSFGQGQAKPKESAKAPLVGVSHARDQAAAKPKASPKELRSKKSVLTAT